MNMTNCPYCGNPLEENVTFCPYCGTQLAQPAPVDTAQQAPAGGIPQQPPVMLDPADHTWEFDPKDISDNKVYCMVIYLMGIVGGIVGLLASQSSPYVAFHVRQALKFTVLNTLLGFVTLLLFLSLIHI